MNNIDLNLGNEKYLSSREAGKISGYTHDYISRLCRSGQLNGEMVGHTWYVNKKSLENFLNKNQTEKEKQKGKLSVERKRNYQRSLVKEKITSRFGKKFLSVFAGDFLNRAGAFSMAVILVFGGFFFVNSTHSKVTLNFLNEQKSIFVEEYYPDIRSEFIRNSKNIAQTTYLVASLDQDKLLKELKESFIKVALYKLDDLQIFVFESSGKIEEFKYQIQISSIFAHRLSTFDKSAWNYLGSTLLELRENIIVFVSERRNAINLAISEIGPDAEELINKNSRTTYNVLSKTGLIIGDALDDIVVYSRTQSSNIVSSVFADPIKALKESAKLFNKAVDKQVYKIVLHFQPRPPQVFGRYAISPTNIEDNRTIVIGGPKTIIQNVVERVEIGGISRIEFNNELARIDQTISGLLSISSGNSTNIINNYQSISYSNKIDDLGSVVIHDSSIVDTDIGGNSRFAGTTISGSTLHLTSTFTSSSTATSTLDSGVDITSGCFSIDGTCVSGGGSGSGTVTSSSAGQVAFFSSSGTTVVGTSTIFIANNEKVGFGTSTPNQKLTIFNSNADPAIEFSATTSDPYKWTIGQDYSDGGKFKISSSSALGTNDRFVIDGSGNVGIATSSPSVPLEILGDFRVGEGNNYNAFFVDATNGLVGIGSSTPAQELSVKGEIFVDGSATSTFLGGVKIAGGLDLGGLTGFLKATSGKIATALIDLANDITGILGVGNGGTGWGNIQANSILLGNGLSQLATTTGGTNGQVLALVAGVPTWQATTTLGTISGTLSISSGGTGATSFTTGVPIAYDGSTLVSTSTLRDFVIDDALTISSSGSVNSTALTDGGTISFDWVDAEIADALTISGGTINNTPIGATTASTAVFTNATTTNATTTNLNISSLTASRAIATDATKNLVTTFASAALLNSLSDETGTGVVVFGTSPTLTTFFGTACTGNAFLQDISDTGAFSCTTSTNDYAFPWDTATQFGSTAVSTSTIVAFTGGFLGTASSTITDLTITNGTTTNATTTNLSISGQFEATSATATSTFAGGLTVQSSFFVVQDGSGFVGIGTASPSAPLEIAADVDSTGDMLILTGVDNNDNANLVITSDANRAARLIFRSDTTSRWSIGRGDSDVLSDSTFYIGSGISAGSNAEFVIDSSGNVGIGTTSPPNTLSVQGDVSFSEGNNYRSFLYDAGLARLTITNLVSTNATTTNATTTNLNISSLTASRAIATDATKNLVTTFASAALLNSLSDETGTGVVVFGTSQ